MKLGGIVDADHDGRYSWLAYSVAGLVIVIVLFSYASRNQARQTVARLNNASRLSVSEM